MKVWNFIALFIQVTIVFVTACKCNAFNKENSHILHTQERMVSLRNSQSRVLFIRGKNQCISSQNLDMFRGGSVEVTPMPSDLKESKWNSQINKVLTSAQMQYMYRVQADPSFLKKSILEGKITLRFYNSLNF